MKKILGVLISFFLASLMSGITDTVNAQDGPIVVIVNQENPINDLSVQEVKNYYTRKTKSRWPKTNTPIYPIDYQQDPEIRVVFLKKVLKMSREAFATYYYQRKISNGERPPITVYSAEQVIMGVQKYEGAIGYVYESEAQGKKGIRIICKIE